MSDVYDSHPNHTPYTPNQWDIVAFVIVFGVIIAFMWGAKQMIAPYHLGETIPISLHPKEIPHYALSSVMRMFIAMGFSVLFTFIFGTLAAKYRQAEKLLIPLIDIMQSIPVLGFLSISVATFIHWFPGSRLGPECAAIFAVFTSQVWNMALSFYQSLRTLPRDISEVAKVYHLNPWQRFWRVEVPFALPGLTWNAMVSMSAGWFFVVASEAISVSNQEITLPGIGSYIALANDQGDFMAIGYAILAMLVVILIYDQLIFRPILSWSERFRGDHVWETDESSSWFLDVLQRTRVIRLLNRGVKRLFSELVNPSMLYRRPRKTRVSQRVKRVITRTTVAAWNAFFLIATLLSAYAVGEFILKEVHLSEVWHVFLLGAITAFKVFILIFLASIIWVPIGVKIGLSPRATRWCQPVVQFIAAFPANLVFPIIVFAIVTFDLTPDIWTSPLMILGTQWYILFNVIASASTVPTELIDATESLGVRRWLWWKRLMLPAVFPYYVTGAMAAAGGCWNASIVADVVNWKETTLLSTGLGGYIAQYTQTGDFQRIALGIGVMCLYVTFFNRLLWQRLYQMAEERYAIG